MISLTQLPDPNELSFNLIYNLEAVAALLKIFMGLALVHFQKYWLLRPGGFNGAKGFEDPKCSLSEEFDLAKLH